MKELKKRFVIFGASNAKYGDFLINNWLKSLKKNIDLSKIDIVILDYGLTINQRKNLELEKVIIFKCEENGHIANIRYRDMLRYLQKTKYEQVMSCDSGDIIIQNEITHLFTENKYDFRATVEDLPTSLTEYILMGKTFSREMSKLIEETLRGKKVINGGVIIAPRDKFINLCETMCNLIRKMNLFGPDQVVLNYYLYQNKFHRLDKGYNYIIGSVDETFYVKNGIFYDKNNKIIPIVHNAGRYNYLRPIKNFGYGKNFNRLSYFSYYQLRFFCNLTKLFKILKNIEKFIIK